MSTLGANPTLERPDASPEPIINDFALVAATANGTGSQTANLTLLRALFKMGIPVNGKNIFPSNIQGLPTWYHIRVSHEGYVARRSTPEVLVAFNPETIAQDIAALPSGGVCIYNHDLPLPSDRGDIVYYGLPVKSFTDKTQLPVKLRGYIANMVYVGAVAYLLAIPLEAIEEALGFHFGKRQKLVDSNMAVVRDAFTWSQENLGKHDPYRVEAMQATDELIMMTGNEAGALGAVFGGVSFAAWYPITPSTSFIDALRDYLPKLRRDADTGKATYTVVQAEDELAAIGMVLGAGWAGARSLTATSGPGISLMAEFTGLGYFAELPAVIWDIQRVGPSTGLPTRTGQGDVTFAYYLGHGDSKNVLLFPATIDECFQFGYQALDLAEQLQTPIFVLSDLDLGMNNWMSKPFNYPDTPMQRGKVLSAEEVEAKGFARYRDFDGDGVTYRTLPGNASSKSAYFARGTGHNADAVYSERSDDWLENMERLTRKFDTARRYVPKAIIDEAPEANSEASLAIIAFGSTKYAIDEARARLAAQGIASSFLRLRALPIGDEVHAFIAKHPQAVVIELNRDGQLHAILQNEVPEAAASLRSIAYMDGMPLTCDWLLEALKPYL